MKQILLFVFLIFCGLTTFSQSRFYNSTGDQRSKEATAEMVKVFPNPATDYISISTNEKVGKVLIYNLVGRQMKDFEAIEGEKYYVGDLPRGMYLVQLLGNDNRVITTRRVNKQ